LFASTPWVILVGRSATPDVLLLSPALLFFSYFYLSRATDRLPVYWFTFIFALALSFYTPGMIWFILIALLFGHKKIIKTILKVKGVYSVAGLTVLILLLLPLGYALFRDISTIKVFLAVPNNMHTPTSIIESTIKSFSALFFESNTPNNYILGKFALLGIAQVILTIIGVFAMRKKAPKELFSLIGLLYASILFSGLNDSLVYLTLGLISIAILDAAGLRYLYKRWFEVFPLNPLAKWFAATLVIAILFASLAYGARYTLLAWPHNMETRKIYVLK
jgi:4-amino-4-deoxy-L-arabinose transferase-like glycosyltransferase